jgi:hypothetical protein
MLAFSIGMTISGKIVTMSARNAATVFSKLEMGLWSAAACRRFRSVCANPKRRLAAALHMTSAGEPAIRVTLLYVAALPLGWRQTDEGDNTWNA